MTSENCSLQWPRWIVLNASLPRSRLKLLMWKYFTLTLARGRCYMNMYSYFDDSKTFQTQRFRQTRHYSYKLVRTLHERQEGERDGQTPHILTTFTLALSAAEVQELRSCGVCRAEGLGKLIFPELTYSYAPKEFPLHILMLKIGFPVMIIRNFLHPRLLNVKIFVVKHITKRLLYVSIIPDQSVRPESHSLHRMDFNFDFSDVSVSKRQFPTRPAFSSTVHKNSISGTKLCGRWCVIPLLLSWTSVCGSA